MTWLQGWRHSCTISSPIDISDLVPTTEPVHVVIPIFNSWPQTETCLTALRRSSRRELLEIVAVDHSPTDTIADALRVRFPEVTRLSGGPELWWAGATNLGIRWAIDHGTTRVMLLNNDCYVTPDTIERLLAHAARAASAIIAPVQRDRETDKVIFERAGTCFLLGFPTFTPPHWWTTIHSHSQALSPTRLVVGGRGVLIPVEVFNRVGLFDETELPHYGADHDFYLRCRKAGVPLLTARDANVYVDSRRTTLASELGALSVSEFVHSLHSRRSHRNLRDLNTLFRKHYPVRGLHYVGVALNLARYLVMYLWHRVARFVAHRGA